jgi:pimeloyl-ACP methyl ester carboxylesterase
VSAVGSRIPSYANKRGLKYLRVAFGALGSVAPDLAARLALNLFLKPRPQGTANWERPLLESGTAITIPFGHSALAAVVWGDGPTVLLTHGWGGHGTQLGQFVEPLVAAGFRVVALDGPAHGESPGKRTDLVEYARAIYAACQSERPSAIIGHSFGAGCTLVAMSLYPLGIDRAVLLSGPSSAAWMIDVFASVLNIAPHVALRMRKLLERRYGNTWTWEQFDIVKMATKIDVPLLVAHDHDDTTIPYGQALAIKDALPGTTLISTSANGHRNIVRDQAVIARTVEFLTASPSVRTGTA